MVVAPVVLVVVLVVLLVVLLVLLRVLLMVVPLVVLVAWVVLVPVVMGILGRRCARRQRRMLSVRVLVLLGALRQALLRIPCAGTSRLA